MVDYETPEDCLTEGIEALGIDPTVARGIAELTIDVERKRVLAGYELRVHEERFQARCWTLLFRLLHRLLGEDPDWNAWGAAHSGSRRMVREEAMAEHTAES